MDARGTLHQSPGTRAVGFRELSLWELGVPEPLQRLVMFPCGAPRSHEASPEGTVVQRRRLFLKRAQQGSGEQEWAGGAQCLFRILWRHK